MSEEPVAATWPSRVVIVYRHLLLRDLAVRLLGNGGIVAVAVIREDDLDLATLRLIEPDVIVIDQACEWAIRSLARIALLGESLGSVSRVVTIGLEGTTMVVCHRQLVAEASALGLVSAVLGRSWATNAIPPQQY